MYKYVSDTRINFLDIDVYNIGTRLTEYGILDITYYMIFSFYIE